MGFLTALGSFMGGQAKGRRAQDALNLQKSREHTLEQQVQQQILDEQQRVAQEKQQQLVAAHKRLRERGIDPVTGLPFVQSKSFSEVVPNNAGHPTIDPSTGQPYPGGASPAQLLAHYYRNMLTLASQGNTPAAAILATEATNLSKQIAEQEAADNALNREWIIQRGDNARSAAGIKAAKDLRGQPTYRDLHPIQRGGPRPNSATAHTLEANWHTLWHKAITPPPRKLGPTGLPLPLLDANGQPKLDAAGNPIPAPAPVALISPGEILAAEKWFSRIDADPHPQQTAEQFAKITHNQALKTLLEQRGVYEKMLKELSQPSGGSDGIPPFPGE